jgi:hypothetical protein
MNPLRLWISSNIWERVTLTNQNCIYEEIKSKCLSGNAYTILFRDLRLPASYLKM